MNCYEFEQNISAFIEGEIKKSKKEEFIKHQNNCLECSIKTDKISQILDNLHSLKNFKTTSSFESTLKDKISDIENKRYGLLNQLKNFKPFGFEPIPAVGLSIAILMIFGSSYLLINLDQVPEVNFNNMMSNKVAPKVPPSIRQPLNQITNISEKDTLVDSKINKVNNSIRLVGGK